MEQGLRDHSPGAARGVLEILLLALAVSGFWYYLYYLLAPWIWRQNLPLRPQELTPWMLPWTKERDGVEIYALYALCFLNILSVFPLWCLVRQLRGRWGRRGMAALALVVAAFFCAAVGFRPPLNSFRATLPATVLLQSLKVMLVAVPAVVALSFLQRRLPRWATLAAALVLVPACFLASSPITWEDYSYVFAPALRLVTGASLADIYFQYDLLLSLLAAGWMKLGLALSSFQLVAQASFFLVILGVYLLARRLFRHQELAALLLAALVLGRLYASPWDPATVFQVCGWRLDLWLPLLVLACRLGPWHWSVAMYCGALLILHRTFGIIYSAAYLQLLLTLCAIEYLDDPARPPLTSALAGYGRRLLRPAIGIAACWILSALLFHNAQFPNYAGYYQKIGIGFMRIATDSFYWYVPALLSSAVALLLGLRKLLPAGYLGSGFLLTYCAIGNSIYFFGRSHEHNILNISVVLLFLGFFLLDLIARRLDAEGGEDGETGEAGKAGASFVRRHGVTAVASALVLVMIVSYSGNILKKSQAQYLTLARGKAPSFDPTGLPGFSEFLAGVREVTGSSSKVYFARGDDFALYYYGGYMPVGYCNPFQTWIFTKDLNAFLQGLLDRGYSLVFSESTNYLVGGLDHARTSQVGDALVIAKSAQQAAPL
jgi:hypothetical protein